MFGQAGCHFQVIKRNENLGKGAIGGTERGFQLARIGASMDSRGALITTNWIKGAPGNKSVKYAG